MPTEKSSTRKPHRTRKNPAARERWMRDKKQGRPKQLPVFSTPSDRRDFGVFIGWAKE